MNYYCIVILLSLKTSSLSASLTRNFTSTTVLRFIVNRVVLQNIIIVISTRNQLDESVGSVGRTLDTTDFEKVVDSGGLGRRWAPLFLTDAFSNDRTQKNKIKISSGNIEASGETSRGVPAVARLSAGDRSRVRGGWPHALAAANTKNVGGEWNVVVRLTRVETAHAGL